MKKCLLLWTSLTLGFALPAWGQERHYDLPADLSASTLLLRAYPRVRLDWPRRGLEDERYFRRQQRRWNQQVDSLNDTLRRALAVYPYPYLLADSAAFDSARETGARYVLESAFVFQLRYETFLAGEAVLDGELVPYYTGPVSRQKSYDPKEEGEVTAPGGYVENRLYYWRIRDLDSGDEYYFEENHSDAVQEAAGLYGSLPYVLPGLVKEVGRGNP